MGLWEEEDFQTNKINPIDQQHSVQEAALVDGDIIVFQENSAIFTSLQLKNAKQFLSEYPKNDSRNGNKGNHGNYRQGNSGAGQQRRHVSNSMSHHDIAAIQPNNIL